MNALSPELLARLAAEHGTPYYAYDADLILERLASLSGFDVVRFAQKACSNVHILRRLREAGARVDAVSLGEIERGLRAGYTGQGEPAGMVYTADLIDDATLEVAIRHGIPVNAGSSDVLEQLGRRAPGHRVWIRVNPGFGHGHSRKTNTGGPWSKHGIWHAYLDEALRHIEKYRLDLEGLHMHIGSGADFDHLRRVCDAMVEQVRALGVDVRAISGGGGLPIPYRPEDPVFDPTPLHALWHEARGRVEELVGHPVSLEIEPGRYLVGEAGVLVARGARGRSAWARTASCWSTPASTTWRGRSCTGASTRCRWSSATAGWPAARSSPPWWAVRSASPVTSSPRRRAAWWCRGTCPTPGWATTWCCATPAPTPPPWPASTTPGRWLPRSWWREAPPA